MFAGNKTTLYRVKEKFEGTVKRKKGPGRSSTSQEQGEEIVQAHEDDPFLIHAKPYQEPTLTW